MLVQLQDWANKVLNKSLDSLIFEEIFNILLFNIKSFRMSQNLD